MYASSHHAGLPRIFAGVVGAVRRQVEARQAERMLMEMSDAMLSDIGIARGDIQQIVRHGRR
jgi:uncharacterized protein YjiS (DUF1127 family)